MSAKHGKQAIAKHLKGIIVENRKRTTGKDGEGMSGLYMERFSAKDGRGRIAQRDGDKSAKEEKRTRWEKHD